MKKVSVKKIAARLEKELTTKFGSGIYVGYAVSTSGITLRVSCDDESLHDQFPTEYEGYVVETHTVPRAGG